MVALLILFSVSGCLLAALSIPLILQKIPPNPLYGFRVQKTLDDPQVWYPVNSYAAKRMLAVAVVSVLVSLALFFVPGIDVAEFAVACGMVEVGGLIVAIVQSFLYLRGFQAKES